MCVVVCCRFLFNYVFSCRRSFDVDVCVGVCWLCNVRFALIVVVC